MITISRYICWRNVLIIVIGGVFTLTYSKYQGNMMKPVLFTGVVFFFSCVYTALFPSDYESQGKRVQRPGAPFGHDCSMQVIADRIQRTLKKIRVKSKSDHKFKAVSRFMSELNHLEETVPKLMQTYKRAAAYTKSHQDRNQHEMNDLQRKVISSKGTAKETYRRAWMEKRMLWEELKKLQMDLDETESRLYYILCTLQKIEAIIETAELDERLTDRDIRDLNFQLESFSEGFREMLQALRV